MAVSLHAAGSVQAVSATTATPTFPANSVGDVLLLCVVTSGTPTATPSGWTLVSSDTTSAAHVYVYWMAVTTVQSGTVTVTMTASATNRSTINSYSGANTAAAPLAAASGNASASTTMTSPSLTYPGFVVWVNGRPATSTLSAQTSTSGTWTSAKENENSGSNALTVFDGPITAGTTTTLSATSSASVAQGNVALSLIVPSAGGGTQGSIKADVAGSFVAKPVKVWTGSAWAVKPLKWWNGSAWVKTNY